MSLEWFDRVSGELQDHLESICEKYDQIGHMSVDRGAKHPRMEFYVDTEDDDREYFCTLYFDPHNEEFYIESIDVDLGQTSKTILSDIEDIIDAVHESLHDFLNDEDFDDEDIYDDMEVEYSAEFDDDDYVDDSEEYYIAGEIDDDDDVFEEIDVEWETPEVTAFIYEDEVEVTYQFGIVGETGDGVLRRVNRIWTEDDELIKDETNFIFSKEEAGTIISLIASHMDSMTEYRE
ncbi:hypothetical protein ACFYKX_02290 [Cytobacillus sp. FJAT-54145]|uniref:Uncharacterized protein n=1 Tax=Cytobacillus spartinae TaxID=3299023 RepID=A0ABW6K5K2_9BACI